MDAVNHQIVDVKTWKVRDLLKYCDLPAGSLPPGSVRHLKQEMWHSGFIECSSSHL